MIIRRVPASAGVETTQFHRLRFARRRASR